MKNQTEFTLDKDTATHMLEFLKENTDECYAANVPYPPSDKYIKFYNWLADTLGEPHYYNGDL